MRALVDGDWLERAIRDDAAVVLDATLFLPEHGRDARTGFTQAHIPGARFLDLDALRDIDSDLPNTVPPAEDFAARMRALGVGGEDRVVVYDDSPLHSAARAWWLLRHFGHRHVALLDGGLALWRAQGRPVERGAPGAAAPADFTATPGPTLAAQDDVARTLARGGQVVDARSPARFAGAEPERTGVVPGHMPGARNLHYARLFDGDGRWLRGGALRAAFTGAGIDPDAPMVITCGSGITAAVPLFAAHLLGNDAVRLYDGSWSEWGADPDTAKAGGAA